MSNRLMDLLDVLHCVFVLAVIAFGIPLVVAASLGVFD